MASPPILDGVLRDQADGTTVAYMIPPYASNHASTIEVLPDGTLTAAWFSGAHEEAPGCAIVFARLLPGSSGWTSAATLAKQDKYSDQNPVLFYDNTTSVLHLFHSHADAESGESQAQIWHLESKDHGVSWTESEPYFTVAGDFPRNRIIRRKDNTLLFPYYNQGTGHPNHAVIAVSKTPKIGDSSNWESSTVDDSDDLVQPTVVRSPTEPGKLVMFFRDRRAQYIYRCYSTDEGKSWSQPKPTVLPNNNAGIEANSLLSGKLVMVFNPQNKSRDPIAVATSSNNGLSWPNQRLLQNGNSTADLRSGSHPGSISETRSGNEFSYPTVLQTKDGFIHVMYTYNRQTIKYVRFKETWIQ